MIQFFETPLGQKLINATIKHEKGIDDNSKRTADALERIATALEAISTDENETKDLIYNINETLKWKR